MADDPAFEHDDVTDSDDTEVPSRWRVPAGAIGAGLVVLLVVAAVGLWWRSVPFTGGSVQGQDLVGASSGVASASPSADVSEGAESPGPSTGATPSASSGAEVSAPAAFVVHVAGAVHAPGVVSVPAGARVADAVAAAGGVTAEAAPSAVNLARLIEDGEQIVIPTLEEAADLPDQAGSAAAPAGGGSPADVRGVVDINRADATTLDALPGIGPALAGRIVAWRESNGPFETVDDLASVSGIGPATVEKLRDSVTVGP